MDALFDIPENKKSLGNCPHGDDLLRHSETRIVIARLIATYAKTGHKGWQFWPHIGSDRHQMEQIYDFLRSILRLFELTKPKSTEN